MSARLWTLIASGGSAGLLLAAYGFQHLGGLAPCTMCLWQRWPHGVAIVLGVIALSLAPTRLLSALGALAALTTAGIGGYHTGVERGWWEGPSTCTTSGSISDLSPQQLLDQIMTAPLVRCDEVPWELFSLSMASWNMIASLVFALAWIMAFRRT